MTDHPQPKEFNRAIQECIKEVDGWIGLHNKKHQMLLDGKNYSFPKEAQREHDNTIRLLQVLINKFEGKKINV